MGGFGRIVVVVTGGEVVVVVGGAVLVVVVAGARYIVVVVVDVGAMPDEKARTVFSGVSARTTSPVVGSYAT